MPWKNTGVVTRWTSREWRFTSQQGQQISPSRRLERPWGTPRLSLNVHWEATWICEIFWNINSDQIIGIHNNNLDRQVVNAQLHNPDCFTRNRRWTPQPAPTTAMTDKFPNGPFLRSSCPQRRQCVQRRHAASGKHRRPMFEAHVRAGRLSDTGTQLRRPQNDRSWGTRLSETCGHHSYQPRRMVTQRQEVNRFSKCEDHRHAHLHWLGKCQR